MEPQVGVIVHKVYKVLSSKESASDMTDKELAYITGKLETLLDLFAVPSGEEPPDEGFKIRKLFQ